MRFPLHARQNRQKIITSYERRLPMAAVAHYCRQRNDSAEDVLK